MGGYFFQRNDIFLFSQGVGRWNSGRFPQQHAPIFSKAHVWPCWVECVCGSFHLDGERPGRHPEATSFRKPPPWPPSSLLLSHSGPWWSVLSTLGAFLVFCWYFAGTRVQFLPGYSKQLPSCSQELILASEFQFACLLWFFYLFWKKYVQFFKVCMVWSTCYELSAYHVLGV